MSGIYFFSTIIFFCFFINGYKKFFKNSLCENKKFLICSIIIHVLFIVLHKKITYITGINFLFNFLSAFIIYKFSCRFLPQKKAVICSAFFILNPVFIIYCSTWTNLYSLYIFSIILMFISYVNKKIICGHALFIISFFFYPHAVFLYPILLAAQAEIYRKSVRHKNYEPWEKFKVYSLNSLMLISASLLTFIIFKFKSHSSIFAYSYASCNAFNLWTTLSFNWRNLTDGLLSSSYGYINSAILLCSGAIAFLLFKKQKNTKNYFLISSLIYIVLVYNFAFMIHEDFFTPILILLLLLFITTNSKTFYSLYLAFSALHFMNLCYTLSLYNPKNFNVNHPFAIIISFISVLLCCGLIYYFYKYNSLWLCTIKPYEMSDNETDIFLNYNFMPSQKVKYSKQDFLIMTIFSVVFAALAFFRLGNNFIPETSYNLYNNKGEIVINLEDETYVDHLSIFLGELGRVYINVSLFDSSNNSWYELNDKDKISSEYAWNDIKIEQKTKFIKITPLSEKIDMRELVICDKNNNGITPQNTNDYIKLFDEQNMHPETNTYLFGTMFDEVYYTRTIYEFMNGLPTYEITHPPLGKSIMVIGVKLFGLNPFGWRFMSVIFGFLMVPVMYIFSKRLFKNSFIPAVTTCLLCFDFIHFTLSRICTIDVFVAFFILLMYYFMYWYITVNFNDMPLKKTFVPLLLCGISTALAISTKWTGFYAASGLAIIFFASLYLRYWECKNKERNPVSSENINNKFNISSFKQNSVKTILFCILCFVIIPVSVYLLSYIPVVTSKNTNNLLLKACDNFKLMLNYHSNINSTHIYSSHWYEWPLIKRPLFDSIARFPDGETCSSVSTFGNPVIWWVGILCVIYCFYLMVKEKDRKAAFLTVSYLAQLIPWMFVSRYIMIYHYFPCSLFQILIIGYCIEKMCSRFSAKSVKRLSIIYCILAILAFTAFYPAISGYPVSKNYIHTYLELRETWNFE